jgi:6-phosphogluconolactonase
MMGITPRIVVGDIGELQRTLAKEFAAQAAQVTSRRGKFIVALSGGSVAPAFFPTLATLAVDWTRIDIFWIDERAVPPDHPDSNFGLASRLLIVPAQVPAVRIHRMYGELPDLDQAARRATDELKSIAGDPPHLDLAILGVGADGHIASIFGNYDRRRGSRSLDNRSAGLPPSPAASADDRRLGEGGQPCHEPPVIPIYDSPKPPARRLTLTLPVLAGAGLVIVAALGESKADVMRDALHQPDASTPVAELLRRASSSLVLLDCDAGLS